MRIHQALPVFLFLPVLPLIVVDGLSSTTAPPEWLMRRLTEFDLRIHDFPDTGRGLQTTRDRSEGAVLVKVPKDDAVTATSILERYQLLSTAAETSIQTNGVKLSDEQVLAVGLLLLKKDNDRYANSLPPQYSVLQMPEHLTSYLPATYQRLIRAYRQHCSDLRESIMEVLLSIEDNTATTTMSELVTDEAFQWAFATVRSRCVGMDGEDDDRVRTGGKGEIRVMLPGFDLLNHKFGSLSSPGFDEQDNVYYVKSNNNYQINDQVFISYSDQRDNLQMLMTYGFVAPGNPQRTVNFDVQDLFHAMATARPAYFVPPVLQQLWGLMKKLGKHRDLYEWTDGKPQDSLSNGIDMMADIEKQFIKEGAGPDINFGRDVLESMTAARRKELAVGIERLTQALDVSEDETWIPLMSSMKLLMEEEERYLGGEDCTATKEIN